MAERKTRVAILFGGRSAEHDVSRASAANVLRSLDSDRYEVTLIGITRDGRWTLASSIVNCSRLLAHAAAPNDNTIMTDAPSSRMPRRYR